MVVDIVDDLGHRSGHQGPAAQQRAGGCHQQRGFDAVTGDISDYNAQLLTVFIRQGNKVIIITASGTAEDAFASDVQVRIAGVVLGQ